MLRVSGLNFWIRSSNDESRLSLKRSRDSNPSNPILKPFIFKMVDLKERNVVDIRMKIVREKVVLNITKVTYNYNAEEAEACKNIK